MHTATTPFFVDGKLVGNVSRPGTGGKVGYVGTEGNRDIFFLKFVSYKSTSRGYTVYRFVDELGNPFVCFSNDLLDEHSQPLASGCCYILKATVKRHQLNTYSRNSAARPAPPGRSGGEEETVVNRILVIKTIGTKMVTEVVG